MVTSKRIMEEYRFFVYNEPTNEVGQSERYTLLRERFGKIVHSPIVNKVLLAMGKSDNFPLSRFIQNMNDDDFQRFLDEKTSPSTRKSIWKDIMTKEGYTLD
jgi:hypothetical protein